MEYLSHSARHGRPPQTYQSHVEGVCALAEQYAKRAARFAQKDGGALVDIVMAAAETHDIGKLDTANQQILHETNGARHLPVHHQDAGAALLMAEGAAKLASFLVQSHHTGLPDIADESCESRPIFRDDDPQTRMRVDRTLDSMARLHRQLTSPRHREPMADIQGDMPLFLRMGLSCLSAADHTDTARHYGQYPANEEDIPLYAEGRLINPYRTDLSCRPFPKRRPARSDRSGWRQSHR